MFKRFVALFVTISFVLSYYQPVYAQDFNINQLPVPGSRVGESTPFTPLALKGLVINLQKPLEFKFIVDTGHGPQDTASIKDQANQLVKYFLAGLTIPEGDLWVNLSPYEKNRMVPEALGQTDLGRDLLAQDYILKQLTASLIYPEKDLGKEFWSRVYAKAQQQFGTTNVPVNTFNKVWILPDQAQVFEHGAAAYVTKATLKVMLDEDYLALQKHMTVRNGTDSIGSNIVREIVIPEITKEVNTGKNFAPLRQIYQALILAKWYKETIQNGLLDAVYTNRNKVAGVNLNDPAIKEQIYERYLKAYKKGAFNYIKEDPTPDGQVVPRKYFSGGLRLMPERITSGLQSDIKGMDGAMVALDISLKKLAPFSKDLAMNSGNVERQGSAAYNDQDFPKAVNPVQLLIDQPELKEFTEEYLRKRYVHWGLPENLARSILNTLILNVHDLSKGKSEVYKNVVDFETDPQWRAAYDKYKYEVKYTSAFDQIKKYVQDLPPGAVIVDLGAGNNVFGAVIAKNMPQSIVIGVDLIDYDEKSGIPNLKYLHQSSPTKLPDQLKDGSVDVITMKAAIHHVSRELLPGLIAEIKRVLKPNGKLILIEETYSTSLPPQEGADMDLTSKFLQLVRKYGDQFGRDFLAFNDWYSNIITHKVVGMDLPYEFRSIEGWESVISQLGLSFYDAYHIGFDAKGFHVPISGIIVFDNKNPAMIADAILTLQDSRSSNVALVGSKAANLKELSSIPGISVPNGFSVTTSVFQQYLDSLGISDLIDELEKKSGDLKHFEENSPDHKRIDGELQILCDKIQKKIESGEIDPLIEKEIISAYRGISKEGENSLVAVRSSATAEDLLTASFAGQYDTFLNVHGPQDLIEAIKKVWASTFNFARAVDYRNKQGISHKNTKMAVLILEMVQAETAGTAFSVDMRTGMPMLMINNTYGLGEAEVSGEVSSDTWIIDPKTMKVFSRQLGGKKKRLVYSKENGRNAYVENSIEESERFAIGSTTAIQIAEKLRSVHDYFTQKKGWKYLDIEYAVRSNGEIVLLQARPATLGKTKLAIVNQKELKKYEKDHSVKFPVILTGGMTGAMGVVTGVVRVSKSLAEAQEKVNPGDILVTENTMSYWEKIMGVAGGMITAIGGPGNHTAVVAREEGKPAIVGNGQAIDVLRNYDGQVVTIDALLKKVYLGAIPKECILTPSSPDDIPTEYSGLDNASYEQSWKAATGVGQTIQDPDGKQWIGKPNEKTSPFLQYIHRMSHEWMAKVAGVKNPVGRVQGV